MKKNSLFIAVCTLLVSALSFGQAPKFSLNFEGANPLSNLPAGVTNVNGTNTVRVKNTTNYPAIPNAVQSDGAGGNELFLDFQGYLKINVPAPSNGFSLAYDYRRNNLNDDWYLGFLSFIGNYGAFNKLEKILIEEWDGKLDFGGVKSADKPIGFDTTYKIVVTCSPTGDVKLYVDNVLKLSAPNSTSGYDIHNWTNASLLVSFKGDSYDGTNVIPENEFASNARDTRAFVDNVELYERELNVAEVDAITFPKAPKYVLDFESASPLSNLPTGVTNVNGTNTVRIKNTTNYPAIPNAVQSDGAGGKELFLDFQGYLKMNLKPKNGFSIAYDYRRTNINDDWMLGFLTFIGKNGNTNTIRQLYIREWDGQLAFGDGNGDGPNSGAVKPIGFNTDYKVVVTVNKVGDLKVYVDNVLRLTALNSDSGANLQNWTNASLLLSFKGQSFDGSNVTPESSFATNARDTRVFVDNIKVYERELALSEITEITYPPFAKAAKFFLDFESANPLSNLPAGVANVNGTNTVRVKNTTNYPAIPNAVQSDGAGGNELFLDFQGYLKINVPTPSAGFSIAYDYRRTNINDDWMLGFLTFIGNNGISNTIRQLYIREWDGQLAFGDGNGGGPNSGTFKPIGFNTDYKVVVTVSTAGDLKIYVDNVLRFTAANNDTGANLQNWTNASLLLSFKGQSFDGTNVSPEGDYATNARDTRAFVDNIALYEGELSATDVAYINSNGNNSLGMIAWNGSANSSWNEPANWTPYGLPSATNNATIATGTFKPYITADASAKSLKLNSSTTLIVNSGNNLTVTDAIVNDGTMTIANNAHLIQVNNVANSGAGTTVINRNSNALKRLDYTMWSSPVSGTQTLAQFSPLTSQSPNRFYTYDAATNFYTNVAPTSTFAAGNGYLIRMPNDASTVTPVAFAGVFTGVPNNGNISLGTPTPLVAGNFYSVGNPYPSPISASSFIAGTTGLGTTLYFWRKTNGTANTLTGSSTGTAYATWTSLGGTASGNVAPNDLAPNGQIAVGQGFIVNTGTATTINFTNAMRTTTAATFLKTKTVATTDRVWLNLTNATGAFSQALIGYTTNATLGLDNGIDGEYINDSPLALTSNINNKEYTIQGRPTFDPTDVVLLNFKTGVAGDYTIAIDHADGVFATGQDVYLVDNKTGQETNLKSASYTFTAATGADNSRFSLKYQKTLSVNAQSFDDNSITVYANSGTLYVNSKSAAIKNVTVYDIQGRLIAQKMNVQSATTTINNLRASNQVLIVKIEGEDNSVVTKKLLN